MPANDVVIDLHCFGTCVACVPPPVAPGCTDPAAQNYDDEAVDDDGSCTYLITFQVDMSNETIDPLGAFVAGNFNGFDPGATPLSDAGGGVYSATVTLQQGQSLLYKFLNGPDFAGAESVPGDCGEDDGFGGNNRTFTVPANDAVIDLQCFGLCTECGPAIVAVTFRVNTQFIDVDPAGIHIAGSFQGFDPTATPMVEIVDDIWVWSEFLAPGTFIEYKFINGTAWDVSENVPSACGFDNGVGGFNRFLTVQGESIELDIVCFGFCESCENAVIEGCTNSAASNFNPIANADDGSCVFPVTFIVNMGNIDASPAGVFIGANFQDFQAGVTQLADAGNGLYTLTIGLPAGYVVEYKYINGIDWSQAESVPEQCGTDDGFGGFQRIFTVMSEANFIPVHCFGSCQDCIDCTGVEGCTYPSAANYDPDADQDDGSCLFEGCTDALAVNYSPVYNVSTPTCIYPQDFCGEGTIWDADTQTCIEQTDCVADLNNDGIVNASDLGFFLTFFGVACD